MKFEAQQKQEQETAAVSNNVPLTAMMDDQILKTAELARLLKVGQAEVLAMVKAGLIPYMKLGKGFRFLRSQVLVALAVMAEATAAEAAAEAAAERARQV